jgi:hypothetical protein
MPRQKKQQSPTELALDIFKNWSQNDIRTLRDLLTCMVEPPEPQVQELPRGPRRGGYFERKKSNGRSYYYYRYRCGGVLKSLYIGKDKERNEPPAGIEGLAAMRAGYP